MPKLPKFLILVAAIVSILALAYFAISFTPNASATVSQPSASDWWTVGANSQRTSWVFEEVRGDLKPEWYRPIEPYIPYKIQPIATNGKIYVSSAKGLYAINAASGNVDWVYPTELPLGNSPTVTNLNGTSVAYVGGYDRKIHAIDALTGKDISGYTPYEAGAGFEANPVVTNGMIYAGNRDGYFYAFDAATGALKWKFQTGGPISFSAAYKNAAIYFASNDMYTYALNANNGTLVWKSQKLLGAGFASQWPVVYTEKVSGKDYIIFTGSDNFRMSDDTNVFPQPYLHGIDQQNLFPCYPSSCPSTSDPVWPTSTISGTNNYWGHDVYTIDVSAITNYYANKPQYRNTFILDAASGQEYTFDSNGDGKLEYAPFTFSGVTGSGNKYPPVINGVDGVFYADTMYIPVNWISRGFSVGWKWGDHFVSRIDNRAEGEAVDEPRAYAGGGKLMYWSLCCDRMAGAIDVTTAYGQSDRAWQYFGYNLLNLAPDYQQMYNDGDSVTYNDGNGWQVYSGKNQSKNGGYGKHGTTQSPPIPYQGRVYMLRGNSLIAWSPTATTPNKLPLAATISVQNSPTLFTQADLQGRLETEIQKMLSAGPLRPGYHSAGFFDLYGTGSYSDDRGLGEIWDYFQNPSDTVVTLVQTLPYLSPTTQSQVKTYLQTNYGPGAKYDFTKIVHIGWGSGAAREAFDIPPDDFAKFGTNYSPPLNPSTTPVCGGCGYWKSFPPYSFYAAWKYVQTVGNNDPAIAKAIFDAMSSKLEAPPSDTFLTNKPYFINLYAAGYQGYLELQKLAGYPQSSTAQSIYNHLLSLRISNFTKDSPYISGMQDMVSYANSLAIARNFMFLTPEMGDYLNKNALAKVQTALDEYTYVAPYWFVSKYDDSYGEATFRHLYDYPALFQAKAYILKQPYDELVKWLDVPAFVRGDLFYIQNLVAALSSSAASVSPTPTQTPTPSPTGGTATPAPTPTPTPTSSPTPVPISGIITLGDSNTLPTADSGNGNLLLATKYSLTQTATIQNLSFNARATGGQLVLGIYADSAGRPGSLKAQTAAFTPTLGWNTENILSPVSLSAGDYWIAYLPQDNTLGFYVDNSGGNTEYYSYTFGGMPTNFSTSTSHCDCHWSFYATLNTGIGGPVPTLTPLPTPTAIPAPTSCTLTQASWSKTQVSRGDSVGLDVTATGSCSGQQVNFEVRRNGLPLIGDIPADTQPVTVTLTSSNQALGTWVAEYNPQFLGTDPEYYFKATLAGGNTIQSAQLLKVTQKVLTIAGISDNSALYPNSQVPKYEKFEITFQVNNTLAQNLQMPYDPNPPAGVKEEINSGISVDAQFSQDNFTTVYTQPAFYYQDFDHQTKNGKEWLYPTNGQSAWKVRFAPPKEGVWQYKLIARDASGTTTSPIQNFTVAPSNNHGFIKIAKNDSRYFEFDDGTYFPGLGYNLNYDGVSWANPILDNQANFQKMGQNGIQLARIWLSEWSIFGSAWNTWTSLRNDYGGYIPRTGLSAFKPSSTDFGRETLKLAYEESGSNKNTSWFDACRMTSGFEPKAPVKPNTNYHFKIRYYSYFIDGPRNSAFPNYGFVVKLQNPSDGNWHTNCYEPGTNNSTGMVISSYAHDSNGWAILEGDINSGSNDFLPPLYLALENVKTGSPSPQVYIDYVELKEKLPDGSLGVDVLPKSSMSQQLYFAQRNSYAFDTVLELAHQDGIYFKPVILEKGEDILNSIDYNGNFADSTAGGDYSNFYGNYRTVTKVRWLDQAWWRYLQARWGYSTNIQSWELLNEGDPWSDKHYTLADELGKYMRQFTPDNHLVTTSFWHSFPKDQFWANTTYPNVDFADVHQYVPKDTDPSHFNDTALSTIDVSLAYGAKQSGGAGKPVIRGETGFTNSGTEPGTSDFMNDTSGIWLHKFVWGGINPGGLIESYWYSDYEPYGHIYTSSFDHRSIYGTYYNFIKDVPLSNGNYVDAATTVSDTSLRVLGQKDPVLGRAHLWIDNKNDTWSNVVNKVAISPVSTTVKLSGMPAGTYTLKWFDTYHGTVSSTVSLNSDASGNITIPISNLSTDIAVKLERQTGTTATPTTTPAPTLTPSPNLTPSPTVAPAPTATPQPRAKGKSKHFWDIFFATFLETLRSRLNFRK